MIAAAPFAKELVDLDGVVTRLIAHGQTPLVPRLGELTVEAAGFEVLVFAAHHVRRGSLAGGHKDDFVWRAVIQRPQAHRARMGDGVDRASGQVLRAQLPACLANSKNLRVVGGVVRLGYEISALGEDFTVLDDDCPERQPALGDTGASDLNGALCKIHRNQPTGSGRTGQPKATSSSRARPVPLVG